MEVWHERGKKVNKYLPQSQTSISGFFLCTSLSNSILADMPLCKLVSCCLINILARDYCTPVGKAITINTTLFFLEINSIASFFVAMFLLCVQKKKRLLCRSSYSVISFYFLFYYHHLLATENAAVYKSNCPSASSLLNCQEPKYTTKIKVLSWLPIKYILRRYTLPIYNLFLIEENHTEDASKREKQFYRLPIAMAMSFAHG